MIYEFNNMHFTKPRYSIFNLKIFVFSVIAIS